MSATLNYFGSGRLLTEPSRTPATVAEARSHQPATEQPAISSLEQVWNKLNRRKVVQWGVAYVAASWGFLQVLEYVSDIFEWSLHLQQAWTLALLIGLPFVLVLSWYHGDRGQQKISTQEISVLTLLFLLGASSFWLLGDTLASTLEPDPLNSYSEFISPIALAPVEMPSEYAVLVAENAALKLRLSNSEAPVLEEMTPSYLVPLTSLSSKCND